MPLQLQWEYLTLPTGSNYIREDITGTLINQNMKETSELTIPTINLKSLKIIYSSDEPEMVKTSPGWNLLSVPVHTDDMRAKALFPAARSRAFVFDEYGYTATDELITGQAYWLKFDESNAVPLWGSVDRTTIPVRLGWNLIGPFAENVPISTIESTPANIIISDFLSYNKNYTSAEVLESGRGYWILVSEDGQLSFSADMGQSTVAAPAEKTGTTTRQLSSAENGAVTIPIVVADATGQSRTLHLGLHPQASAGINSALMEEEVPPMPPAKVFEARLVSGTSLGEGSYVDYRRGDENFVGTVDYEIQFQSTNNAKVVVSWDLPDHVTGTVTDELSPHIINKNISGAGQVSVTMVNVINRLKFSLNFTAQPSITVTSPNGGDTLRIGEQTLLTWDSQNIQTDVIVALSRDNGSSFETLATVPNTDSFLWTVTQPAASTCLLQVSTPDGSVIDRSDADFAINFPLGVQDNKLPTDFDLAQNYPNPFNPSTTIRYQLPVNVNVQLVIINSIGQVIRTLTDGMTLAGSHSVLWDGRDDNGGKVSSGLYFYRLQAGDFSQTRKMILMQ